MSSPVAEMPSKAPLRRTQEQRRTETRRALLDATVEALVEVGYSRTTTTEVCSRAGVSQGALFRYYPTKHDLLAASVEHLYEQLLQSYVQEMSSVDPAVDDLPEALETLWHTFRRPELAAAYELHVAARTDPELKRLLATVTAGHASAVRATARDLFREAASDEHFGPLLDTALEAFQGMVISRMVAPDDAHEARVLEVLQRLARFTFQSSDRANSDRRETDRERT